MTRIYYKLYTFIPVAQKCGSNSSFKLCHACQLREEIESFCPSSDWCKWRRAVSPYLAFFKIFAVPNIIKIWWSKYVSFTKIKFTTLETTLPSTDFTRTPKKSLLPLFLQQNYPVITIFTISLHPETIFIERYISPYWSIRKRMGEGTVKEGRRTYLKVAWLYCSANSLWNATLYHLEAAIHQRIAV